MEKRVLSPMGRVKDGGDLSLEVSFNQFVLSNCSHVSITWTENCHLSTLIVVMYQSRGQKTVSNETDDLTKKKKKKSTMNLSPT